MTTSDIEASASFNFKSEGREEMAEIADVPAFTPAHTPAPALERVEEQSHTPGSRKSMRKCERLKSQNRVSTELEAD